MAQFAASLPHLGLTLLGNQASSCSCKPHCIADKSLQSCATLCNPMDYSPTGFSVLGISQARTLEWVAMPSSRVSSRPRVRTHISMSPAWASGFFTTRAAWEAISPLRTWTSWPQGLVLRRPARPQAALPPLRFFTQVCFQEWKKRRYLESCSIRPAGRGL